MKEKIRYCAYLQAMTQIHFKVIVAFFQCVSTVVGITGISIYLPPCMTCLSCIWFHCLMHD
uniref:Uncharacterized protein n=1 Tax=Anguilla anguilla TaxID=7936 RepID=A0A0E9U0Z4_ANGAN